jgi:hypothetical protein
MTENHGSTLTEESSPRTRLVASFGALFVAFCTVGCEQTVSYDRQDGLVASIEVVHGDNTVTVDLAQLEAVTFDDGESYARLADIVNQAQLAVPPEDLEFDFEGADGYRPSSRSTCAEHIPATWTMLEGGYVHRTNQNMAWDEQLEMPGCARVKQLVRIHAITSGTMRHTVEVTYQGTSTVVDVRDLDRVEVDGSEQVSLRDIVGYTELDTPLAELEFDFLAGDGYRPSASDNCIEVVPVAGHLLNEGYLSFDGLDLSWNASLNFPRCLNVGDVVRIEARKAKVVGPTVEVTYHGQTITVDLGKAPEAELEGPAQVLLSDAIALAALGIDATSLLFNLEAADGFMPHNNPNCSDFFPLSGDLLPFGSLELETLDLSWHDDAGLPRCANVRNLARILVADGASSDGPFIEVIYGDSTVTVDVSTLERETFRGQSHVRLVDVIEAADLGPATAELAFDFIARDGYRSSSAPTCAGIVPLAGGLVVHGRINVETSELDWTDESEMPGCVHVQGLAQIEAVDPA